MRNNTFGVLIEAWSSFAAQGPSHLNYYEVIGSLFPACPSVSAASRMKTTQPPAKTLARFVFETSTAYSFEQNVLLPDRIQPKFRPDLDYGELKEYVWDVLSCIADGDAEGEGNLFTTLIATDYPVGAFRHGFSDVVLQGFDDLMDEAVIRKIYGYLNQLDDNTIYNRFEQFAVLFFTALAGEPGIDAVIAAGLPSNISLRASTPVMDSYASSVPMVDCGFTISQLELDPDGHPRVLESWDFPSEATSVVIGREGPDVVLVPPSGSSWAVSRHQARIFLHEDGSYWLEDLSLNGTVIINGKGITALRHTSRQLSNHDRIWLAPVQEVENGAVTYHENWECGNVLKFRILRKKQ